jgi:hypothetical protein
LVKEFKHVARDQTCILGEFQKQKWVSRIPNPFAKAVDTKKASGVVYNLNQTLQNKKLMHFTLDGTGGVRWNLGPKPTRSRKSSREAD